MEITLQLQGKPEEDIGVGSTPSQWNIENSLCLACPMLVPWSSLSVIVW